MCHIVNRRITNRKIFFILTMEYKIIFVDLAKEFALKFKECKGISQVPKDGE